MKNKFLFIVVFLAGCAQQTTLSEPPAEQNRWQNHIHNCEIIRDDFGVPHIYGKSDADAVFGLLYAQCEDDFNRVEQNYIWATGRLAEVEGEQAIYSDLRANLFMTHEEAIINYNNSPAWLQKLCLAFADGINFYLYKHPEVQPKLITHFEPWMPMYFSEGSIGGDIEQISLDNIKQFYEPSLDHKLAFKHTQNNLSDPEPKGSNGFAIAGSKTASGNTMLLINPHTSFFFRGEAHVISKEGLNVYGAVTWGQFFVYQGFNEKAGWMHTSSDTDIMDEFEETVEVTANGLFYKHGNQKRSIDSSKVNLKYRSEEGFKDKSFVMYKTHHGPVTHSVDGKWISTAMMWNPVKALEQSYLRTKSAGQKEFQSVMELRTNSSNNTVYADADGTIAYYHGNFIPKRNKTLNYALPVNGCDTSADWKGLHELSDNIFVMNPPNGWIQNCNSTPYTCAGEYSPKKENYPDYMSICPENFRGIHAIDLLNKAKNLTLDGLITLAYDPYLPGAETLIKGLLDAYDSEKQKPKNIQKSINILRSWDFKVSEGSKAMTLCHYYMESCKASGLFPPGSDFVKKVNYMCNVCTPSERLKIFETAIKQLQEDFGSKEVAWGEVNRFQRVSGDIYQQFNDSLFSIPVGMTSGNWGALASYGARRGKGTNKQYGVSGNSFVAVVEFGPKVKAKTLMAGGQSGNPYSPHFNDQALRYANCNFKDVPFYKQDVLKKAKSTYRPGEEMK